MALWIATERAQPGPVFGSKGEQRIIHFPLTRAYDNNLQIISTEWGSSLIRAHIVPPCTTTRCLQYPLAQIQK